MKRKKQDYNKIIFDTLKSINEKLALARYRLNYATDNDMIDSIIYEIKALQTQYSYYNKICRGLKSNDQLSINRYNDRAMYIVLLYGYFFKAL